MQSVFARACPRQRTHVQKVSQRCRKLLSKTVFHVSGRKIVLIALIDVFGMPAGLRSNDVEHDIKHAASYRFRSITLSDEHGEIKKRSKGEDAN